MAAPGCVNPEHFAMVIVVDRKNTAQSTTHHGGLPAMGSLRTA